jgi:hypothetical protein
VIKKYINLLCIIIFLVGVCVWEEVAIHKYLSQLENNIITLRTEVQYSENVDTVDFLLQVKQLEDYWLEKEKNFCIIINHREVEMIGQEIARAAASIANNSKSELTLSLTALSFYVDNLAHVLGLSWQNLL